MKELTKEETLEVKGGSLKTAGTGGILIVVGGVITFVLGVINGLFTLKWKSSECQ